MAQNGHSLAASRGDRERHKSQAQTHYQHVHDGAQALIYFIRPVGLPGPVKVGFTKRDAATRMKDMQCGSPLELEVWAFFPGDTSDEYAIHYHLIDSHSHGEWFFYTDKMENLVENLKNDINILQAMPTYSCSPIRKQGYLIERNLTDIQNKVIKNFSIERAKKNMANAQKVKCKFPFSATQRKKAFIKSLKFTA